MEFKVNEYQLPDKLTFNYEELKCELQEKVSHYETLVYTDDQIKEAKADRASLNKLKTALNDERIRREKEYMQPFNDFKAKVNEIIGIIDKPVAVIDRQVKEYEEKQKKDKEIKAMREALKVGDEILTIGGIYGRIVRIREDRLVIQVGADKVKFEMMRWSVSTVTNASQRVREDVEAEEEQKKVKPKRLKKSADVDEEPKSDETTAEEIRAEEEKAEK